MPPTNRWMTGYLASMTLTLREPDPSARERYRQAFQRIRRHWPALQAVKQTRFRERPEIQPLLGDLIRETMQERLDPPSV